MNTLRHQLINFVAFQLGWFACVLSAASNRPMLGIGSALLLLGLHFSLSAQLRRDLLLVSGIALIGSSWDSLLTWQQLMLFSSGQYHHNLAPAWISAMWLMFATTINVSLRWLYQRYWLAALLGAIAGPLAYHAGAALDAVTMPQPVLALLVMSIGWALMMPLFIKLAERIEQPRYIDDKIARRQGNERSSVSGDL
ncbi:MAG TPA: DUF2878 domain-containing protein [Gammaproteobacteria bacterium]